ncbi:hypothetical protein ACFFX0_18535 [Citricoccus parietis]|uniref:Uncharacterized protein n=1 Tax=Citricoccus parietis TaxID=592307 RepID=A0ABV5G2D8_9MICC
MMRTSSGPTSSAGKVTTPMVPRWPASGARRLPMRVTATVSTPSGAPSVAALTVVLVLVMRCPPCFRFRQGGLQ